MREVGFVKWFGGHNYRTGKPNDYGFIERKDKPDVYFHKSGLLASEVRISQGTVVSFMSREVGRGTKQEAVAVKLLQDEEDRGVLEYCAWSNDGRLVSKVVERYLSGIPSEDWHKAEDYILRKLANPSYARYLPLETLVKLSRMLNNLDPRARLDLLLKTVERASGSEVDRQIAYGVVDAILALAPDRRAVYWKRLPYALYDNDPALRMKIPLDLHIQCAIRALEPNSTTERDLLFDELRSRLSASPAKSSWSLVPDALLSQAPLWEAAPPNRKVKYLVTLLTIDQDARQVIDVIVGVLQASPPEEQKVLATLLPSWLKRDDSILAFIPGPEQVSILLERRQQGPSWDEAITQILHVLSAADLPRRVRIVDLLPEDIHRDPRFISYLSPSQRVTALAAMCHDDCVPDATLVEQVSAALAQCQPDQRRTLVTALPPLFRQHDGFIEYLEPAERISELVARFNAGTLDEHSATKRIETALQELPESRRPRAVTALPEAIGIQDCLLLFRTPEEQIRVFATRLSDHADERNDDVVASVISRLAMIKPGFRLPAVEFLPTWLKQDHRVLLSLPAPDQLQVLSAFIPNDPVTATALYVAEVASALSVITSGCRNEYLGPFPVWLRLLEPVYRLIPLAQRFTLLLTELRKEGPPGDPTLIDRLGDVLRKAPREDIQSLALEQLPSWIQDDERIFLCLSARDQMRVLLSCLPEVPAPATAPYVERIARALGAIDADTRASFIGCLPSWLLWLGPVYPLVPFDLRFPILLVKLMQEGSTDDPTVLARTVEHLGDLPSDEFANRLRLLPPWALVTVEILRLGQNLSAAEQVEIWWLALTNDLPTVWPFLSRVSKIMALYRAAKERRTWTASSFSGDQATFKEDDLITWCALTIFLSSSLSDGGKVNVFHDVHFALLEHVKTSYGDTTAPIDLSPLLPGCAPKKVPNCEGRHWKRDAAYCPRLQSPCLLFHGVVDESRLDTLKSRWGQQNGARIVADDRLPWQDWSLQELMAASGIEAHLPGLESHDDYVPRLSGWVNRVNEVRSRLSCSHCQAVLLPNMKYARNYAAYNTTVFYCQLGHESVYLNHCWCCGRIIDSRECQIEIEGYRLCLQCGSGPKNSDFAAGDLCPKCGESEMQRLHDGNRRICSFCSHRIRVVAPNPSDYFAGF